MSQTREEEAAQSYRAGATLRELAIEHKVAHQTIHKWLEGQGVKMRSPGQPRRKVELPNRYNETDVVGALKKGITVAQIARHLKVKPGVIYRIARDNGIVGAARG